MKLCLRSSGSKSGCFFSSNFLKWSFSLRVVRCTSTLTTHLGEHHIVSINTNINININMNIIIIINNLSSWSGSPIFGGQGARRESLSRSDKTHILELVSLIAKISLTPYPPILADSTTKERKNATGDISNITYFQVTNFPSTPCVSQ